MRALVLSRRKGDADGVRALAWPEEFREMSWTDIAACFEAFRPEWLGRQAMLEIVECVIASGADANLAGLASMGDLVVVVRPITSPPIEEVFVALRPQ